MEQPLINRVANSSLITFDLEEYLPKGDQVILDIKDWLFEEIILKEKIFREKIREFDWEQFYEKNVAIHCSVDAIIPTWAFMLVASKLEPYASVVVLGDLQALNNTLLQKALNEVDWKSFEGAKIVVKGCSDKTVPQWAYIECITQLRPFASSLMYGEPCSTVPLYKRPKTKK